MADDCLNRRAFLGGVVAAALTPHLRGEEGRVPRQQELTKTGAWVRGGLIDAGGLHEPYLFLVRRGGQRRDARAICSRQQSPEVIAELHNLGVEVFHTHLYKGFGMQAECKEMEATCKAAAIAHGLGMKVDTYVQWNSLMYETFFAEDPRAQQWIQRSASGEPIMLQYGYQQSFRYAPCFANQEYLEYLKRVVHYAIVEAKTDFIHFDNFGLNSEPDSCHCPWCVEGFHKRLRTKYTAEQLRERFGFSRVDFITPPRWNLANDPTKMEVISDPAFQEWLDFRCQLMADALGQMSLYAAALNPEVAIEINCRGLTGENLAWTGGVDHARVLRFTRAFWSEEDNDASYTADGRLISKIRSYKLARAYNNVLLTFMGDDPLRLGEALAFNQTPSYVGTSPLSAAVQQHLDFYRRYRDHFVDAEDIADVWVLRSFASIAFHNAGAQLSAVLAEQALIESRVPFRYAFDADLKKLGKCRILILPDVECLSNEQLEQLQAYVVRGGAIVFIGRTGAFDEWRRTREASDLTPLLHLPKGDRASGEPPRSTRSSLPQGRVGYLEELQFPGEKPPWNGDFPVTNLFFRSPENATEFLDLVQWAAGEPMRLDLQTTSPVAANLTEQLDRRRWMIHLVNYAAASHVAEAAPLRLQLPPQSVAKTAHWHTPELPEAQAIPFEASGSKVVLQLPSFRSYGFLEVTWT